MKEPQGDVILETVDRLWVSLGSGVRIGIRATVLAHIHGLARRNDQSEGYVSVGIENEANVGAGVLILPNVTAGRAAVVRDGSARTGSVPRETAVQANPPKPITKCGVPSHLKTTRKDFVRSLFRRNSACTIDKPIP
jgi:acetyltransferase-like isoleucine patch superfamily enzyme